MANEELIARAINDPGIFLDKKDQKLPVTKQAELVALRALKGWAFSGQSREDHQIEQRRILCGFINKWPQGFRG